MSEYRVTEKGLIAWVENTTEGRDNWNAHRGGSIADYLTSYADYEDILHLVAGDIDYPGDKETNAPGCDIDPYALLLQLDNDGNTFVSVEMIYSLEELTDEERAAKGDQILIVEGRTPEEALNEAIEGHPAHGAIATLCRKALKTLQGSNDA
jgi:hypothetical protein